MAIGRELACTVQSLAENLWKIALVADVHIRVDSFQSYLSQGILVDDVVEVRGIKCLVKLAKLMF